MADTIGEQLKEARESLCTAIFACIGSFESDTGVIVERMEASIEEEKLDDDSGKLAKTAPVRHIHVVLKL